MKVKLKFLMLLLLFENLIGQKSYYDILGVSKNFDQKTLK